MRRFQGIYVGAFGLALLVGPAFASDWPRFRGPNGSGVSADDVATPSTWSATENLKWKVALPGPGSSSPIVVGDKVFVTCWSGYGTGRGENGRQEDLKRHLVCLDRETGATVWDSAVPAVLPEDEYGGMFAEHGYASHTPVSDGERIYVFFGITGALAFDMEGKKLWQTEVGNGTDPRGWGSSSSPVLYENLVIVTASPESNALVGLDKATGKVVWRQEAPGLASTWGSPVLVPVSEKRTDLVIGVPNEIWGVNPKTGGLRWFCEAMATDSFCSSVVAGDGVIYGIEGRGGGSIAVKAGGKDDVTASHVVWSGRDSNRIGTPVLHDGRLYFIASKVANCIDAATGKEIYKERLTGGTTSGGGGEGRGGGFGGPRGQDYSSPVVADGKIYYVARNGDAYVLKAGPEFGQLAVNRVTPDREDFSATPAVSDGALFLRSDKHLYCVAAGK